VTIGRSNIRRWLRNIGFGYAETAVAGLIYVALTPFLIDRLGTEAFAVWLISNAITFYLGFLDLGFGEAQVRLHARFAEFGKSVLIKRLLATTTISLVLAGIVAAAIGLTIAFGLPTSWLELSSDLETDFRIVLGILALNCLIAFPASTLENVYEGAQRYDLLHLRGIGLRIVELVLLLVLVSQGHGVVVLAAVDLVATCLGLLIDLFLVNRLVPGLLKLPMRFDARVWRRIRPFALWASIDEILAEGSENLDEILIGILLPLALLTPYAVCLTVAGLVPLAVRPIVDTFYPLAAGLHARKRDADIGQLLFIGSKLTLIIAAPMAIFLTVFGRSAIHLWIPDISSDVSDALVVLLAVNSLFSAYLWTSTIILMAVNRMRLIVLLTAVEMIIELVLILALAPRFGLIGVAVAGLTANVAVGAAIELPIVVRMVSYPLRRFLMATLGRSIVACVPAVVIALALRQAMETPNWLFLAGAALAVAVSAIAGCALFGTTSAERAQFFEAWRELQGADASAESAAGGPAAPGS
jgi:O-antigen/teichoic acid export membrane protein